MGIELKNINKRFGNFEALNNVSLKFQKGKLTALLGPSGCGKTTLLRTIAGLEHTDSGQIFLNGTDASLTHIKQRQVGFVFQHYALFKHMTVFENIAFSLRIKNKKERPTENQIRNRVFNLLKLIQLDLLSHHFPSQLSGGQRQRVALARALASDPKVLLLDEPFGALDAKVRKELRRWLRNIHDELQMTTIFVTHDQEEALEISDQVILMNNGKIEQIGTPSEIYNEPASEFVYSFLGNVNIFKGKIFGDVLHVGHHRLKTTNKSSVNDGSNVFAFVRPHEFEIFPFDNGNSDIKARIERILPFGPLVKIEVSRLDDIYQADFPHHFEVEITKNELEQKQIKEGSKILLRPSKLQLFKNNFE